MPGLGKSGTSRMYDLRNSQLSAACLGWGITTLLRYGMSSNLRPAALRSRPRYPPVLPAALPAICGEVGSVAHACRSPALPRSYQNYYVPNRRCLAWTLRRLRTPETLLPAHVR